MPELLDRLQAVLGDFYRLERELARGGMSQLFLATEASLNRQVVIKLLPPEMASEVSAARFKQEIQLAAHLQHPHILPVLTAGAQDDLIYYVMPYVAGESLRQRVTSQGKLPVEDAVRIVHEVADALAYAHAQGVVHRDIKPENILLEHGHAVLTDFGVARAIAEAQSGGRLTETGIAVGTPAYMSPEQAAGDRHVDARADVYALAVVGYEMLTGSSPFSGSAQAVMAAHLTETPKPVSELRADTPAPVTAAIAKALAKDPAERLQTAAELRDAVGTPAGGTPAVTTGRRMGIIAAAAVLLVIAGLVAFWPRGWSIEGDPRKSLIVFPFENRTGDPANDWLQEASMNLLGLSLAHWEDLRVFDDERTASLMRRRDVQGPGDVDFDLAQEMAQQANVGTLVIGDIRRERNSLAIEAKVHDVASGDRLATEIVRDDLGSDPRVLLDSLAARILQVSGAPAGERPGVVEQTTTSLEAYRAYLAGVAHLQLFELDSAEARLNRAVELDSAFALAYIQLRNVNGWRGGGGDPEVRRSLAAQAEKYSQTLPPRLKSLIQYHVAYENDQFVRARALLEELIARDSADVVAWYELGEAHVHHRSGYAGGPVPLPHPDSLGNAGKGLRAFQRALALDSSYMVAYFHILDVLATCARPATTFLCLADSAVYGEPAQLRAQFGAEAVEAQRQQAREAVLATAYGWVSAAPRAIRARERLILLLIERERYDEAARQVPFLRDLGLAPRALGYEAQALFGKRQFPEAADRMSEAFATASDDELRAQLFGAYGNAPFIVGAAGRVGEAQDMLIRWVPLFPFDSFPISSMEGKVVMFPTSLFAELPQEEGLFFPEYRTDSVVVRLAAQRFVDRMRSTWAPDTTAYRVVLTSREFGWAPTSFYPWSHDSTILADFFAYAPPAGWQSARAHLALDRADTAGARDSVARHYKPDESPPAEWGDDEIVEAYMWADLLARLGDLEGAVDAYARLDSASYLQNANPGLLIRSWAERGALYQQLGSRQQAIEMYQKFVDALADADEVVQPLVDRARQALAALRGEVTERRRE